MGRTLAVLVLAFASAVPLEAQMTGPIPISPPVAGRAQPPNLPAPQASGGPECTQAGVCAVFPAGNLVSYGFDISGTFVGTLQFEATIDGTNWRLVQLLNVSTGGASATTTAAGSYTLSNIGFLTLRVRATTWTSGTALVSMRRGYAAWARSGGTNPSPTIAQVTITPDLILKAAGTNASALGIFTLDGATFAGGLQFGVLATTLAQPTCSVTTRGLFWSSFGALGVKDAIAVCAKSGTDGYAWRTIY
ncbi:MAG TPA: hypothetical protein VKB41_05050 [Steroidobacteraceae bacterium]|nr:hypothetical protein [Steroidobacteraceae bacterium]